MKKVINKSLIAFLTLVFGCISERKSEIHLSNGKIVLTRIDRNENGLKTILYVGSYTKELPPNYVYVNHERLLDGFEALLEYTDNKVVLLQPYEYFNHVGDSTSIIIKTIYDSSFYSIFYDKKFTNYIRVEN